MNEVAANEVGRERGRDIWEETRSLRPVIEAARKEGDRLRRLPDSIARAFVERDVYRLLLPEDLGGHGVDPLTLFDLAEEVAFYDASAGWNYAIGSVSGVIGGAFPAAMVRRIFSGPDQCVAMSGAAQGRAVAVEGGYRVTGRFAWASAIHQSAWVVGSCLLFDGDKRRLGPSGEAVVVHALLPTSEVRILDTWHVGGMRGTGSTEFEIDDVFVPDERAYMPFVSEPKHPSPLFRLSTAYFGFPLSSVPLGTARSAVAALKDLAARKQASPPRLGLAEQPYTQYAVGKAEAMVEAARLSVRQAFEILWNQTCAGQAPSMETRARLRRAIVHAAEACVEAVQMCYRAAGGSALFENEPFERALRDVNAASGHIVFQRAMMEDAGRAALGLAPLISVF